MPPAWLASGILAIRSRSFIRRAGAFHPPGELIELYLRKLLQSLRKIDECGTWRGGSCGNRTEFVYGCLQVFGRRKGDRKGRGNALVFLLRIARVKQLHLGLAANIRDIESLTLATGKVRKRFIVAASTLRARVRMRKPIVIAVLFLLLVPSACSPNPA